MSTTACDPLLTRSGLLRRVKDWNDQTAWQEFYTLYRPLILRFARKQGLSQTEAEDLAQDTLLAVAKAIRTFQYDRTRSSFKNWLFRLARNRLVGQFRRRPKGLELASGLLDGAGPSATAEPGSELAGPAVEGVWEAEWAECVRQLALERLKGQVKLKHFQIFYLVGVKGQPAGQVARALGVSRAAVYVVRHRLASRFEKALAWAARQMDEPGTG